MNARDVLATNLTALMERHPEIGSQKLLFRTTKVTTSTVGRIKRAEVSATIDNIEALAKAFKIPVSRMLDPRLTAWLDSLQNPSATVAAAALAQEIHEADLNDKQLAILANTLAALKSK